jgi:hypothetical protein
MRICEVAHDKFNVVEIKIILIKIKFNPPFLSKISEHSI